MTLLVLALVPADRKRTLVEVLRETAATDTADVGDTAEALGADARRRVVRDARRVGLVDLGIADALGLADGLVLTLDARRQFLVPVATTHHQRHRRSYARFSHTQILRMSDGGCNRNPQLRRCEYVQLTAGAVATGAR